MSKYSSKIKHLLDDAQTLVVIGAAVLLLCSASASMLIQDQEYTEVPAPSSTASQALSADSDRPLPSVQTPMAPPPTEIQTFVSPSPLPALSGFSKLSPASEIPKTATLQAPSAAPDLSVASSGSILSKYPEAHEVLSLIPNVTADILKETEHFCLVVYQGNQTVAVYVADKDNHYDKNRPIKMMLCSTGAIGAETPIGDYEIYARYNYKKLQDAYGQYCSRFYHAYLFHSVPIAITAKKLEDGRSHMIISEYEKLGTRSSHGCVRLTTGDAFWIFSNCGNGTTVTVTNDCCPAGRADSPPALRYEKPYSSNGVGWDPTDPSTSNPYLRFQESTYSPHDGPGN